MIKFSFKAGLLAAALSSVSVAPVEAITAQGVGKAVAYTAAGVAAASSALYLYVAKPDALMLAIDWNSEFLVRFLLAHGCDVNTRNESLCGYPDPLVLAAIKGNVAIVKMLLEAGAYVNRCAGHPKSMWCNRTALLEAVRHGHTEVVKVLLDAGALVHVSGRLYDSDALDHVGNNDEIRALLLAKKSEQEVADASVIDLARDSEISAFLETRDFLLAKKAEQEAADASISE